MKAVSKPNTLQGSDDDTRVEPTDKKEKRS